MLHVTLEGHMITIKEGRDTIRYDILTWRVKEDDGEWKPMTEPDIRWIFHRYGIKPEVPKK